MSNYEWREPRSYTGDGYAPGPILEADVADDVQAQLYVDYQDEPRVAIVVQGAGVEGGSASTDNPAEWPEVEKYIPRHEWPEEIYAGQHGPAERTPDPAVAQAVAGALADWEEADEDAWEDPRDAHDYPDWEMRPPVGRSLAIGQCGTATLPDGGKLILTLRGNGIGEYYGVIVRTDKSGRRIASTRNPEEWPAIEEVYPRDIWPTLVNGSTATPETEDWQPASAMYRAVNLDMWAAVRDVVLSGKDPASLLRSIEPMMRRVPINVLSA
jgi:hypothetical protein